MAGIPPSDPDHPESTQTLATDSGPPARHVPEVLSKRSGRRSATSAPAGARRRPPEAPLRCPMTPVRGPRVGSMGAAVDSMDYLIPGAIVVYFVRNYMAKGFALGRV